MSFFVETIDYKRECGSCSECCKGWLTGTIYEYQMYPHHPCHFVDDSKCNGCCSIYEHRPEMCSTYKCVWLTDTVRFPEWLKPEKSKIIITDRVYEDEDTNEQLHYWSVTECGQKIDSNVLNYILFLAIGNNINIHYTIGGQSHYHGSDRFLEIFLGNSIEKPIEEQETNNTVE